MTPISRRADVPSGRTLPVRLFAAVAVVAAAVFAVVSADERLAYPKTRKVDHVDTYHGDAGGRPVPLARGRQLGRDRRVGGGAEQGDVRLPREDPVPREAAERGSKQLYNYPKYSAPSRTGEHYFFTQERRPAEPERALRPEGARRHARGADRPQHVVGRRHDAPGACSSVSKDGKYAVYGISQGGSDWQEYRVMEIATKKMLPDKLEWVKVSGAAWRGDGFFYSRYPAPEKGTELSSKNENHQVYFHKVGTPQADDELVYQDPANPQRFHGVRHDRGRAVRDPDHLGSRQGQEGQRGLRARPLEGREDVPPDRRRRSATASSA